jgi:hypothetical protein
MIISVDSKMAVMLLEIMVIERTRCLRLPSVLSPAVDAIFIKNASLKELLETCIL